MSIESVNQFFQEVGQDAAMQQQLQSATDKPSFVNKVMELGHQKGYGFSASEVETSLNSLAAQVQSQTGADGELSEDELEAVAGGGFWGGVFQGVVAGFFYDVAKNVIRNIPKS